MQATCLSMLLPPSSLNSFCTCSISTWLGRPRDHLPGCRVPAVIECTLTPICSYLSFEFMSMPVAINTSWLALDFIPRVQGLLDCGTGDERRFQIHRVSVHTTIVLHDSEIWRQLIPQPDSPSRINYSGSTAKAEALNWQADPDDDLGDASVLHHLHRQAATVPLLSGVISQSDQGNAATTLTGSVLSASINAKMQGRLLSSFHGHSWRLTSCSLWNSKTGALGPCESYRGSFDCGFCPHHMCGYNRYIVWAGPEWDDYAVFWQLQIDMVDLFSWRIYPTSRPGKRQRTAFNQFLQVSHSPVVEDTSRRDSLPHARRFNGVRHRPDRKIWVAEMKPPKHKTKQDFGNFKSEADAARAVDAAYHHYGKPDLLNFPDTSLQFLSTRPTAAPGLDEKAKVKFVKKEAKLLLAAMADSSPLDSTHINSLQILELSASPRRCPSGHFRSLSEIPSPFSCNGSDVADIAVSQPQQWVDLDSICDVSSTGVQTNLETLNSMQISEQGWDCFEDSSTLAAPLNSMNPSAYEIQSMWPDFLIWSPPAPTSSRSPSPSHFQEEIAYALREQQSI